MANLITKRHSYPCPRVNHIMPLPLFTVAIYTPSTFSPPPSLVYTSQISKNFSRALFTESRAAASRVALKLRRTFADFYFADYNRALHVTHANKTTKNSRCPVVHRTAGRASEKESGRERERERGANECETRRRGVRAVGPSAEEPLLRRSRASAPPSFPSSPIHYSFIK